MSKPHRILVIGAGFAGLQAVKGLRKSGAEIVLLDQRNYHLFQPLLYQAATTVISPSEIAWPIRNIMADRQDVTTLLAKVTGVDRAQKLVFVEEGAPLPYDTLIVATGARHSYFGRDEWEGVAPGLKTLEDATRNRHRLLRAFEEAERCDDPQARRAMLTFAVIGAGPTGVELAGMIAELARHTIPGEFRRIDTREAKVLLIEAGSRVLAQFPENLSAYTQEALRASGVDIRLGKPVTAITPEGVTLGDEFIPCRTTLWAAGVAASPAAEWLQLEADRAGRAVVGPDLSIAGHPEVFVIGDTASVKGVDGRPVPGIAPAAKQQGTYVAKVISARLAGKAAPAPFRYRHLGDLATIGRGAAVVHTDRISIRGRLAWWVWGLAHIYFLIGTRSRAAVAWSWLWTYLRAENTARLITDTPVAKQEPKA